MCVYYCCIMLWVHVCKHRMTSASFSVTLHLIFLRQHLSLNVKLTIFPGQCVLRIHLPLPLGLQSHAIMRGFWISVGNLNSGDLATQQVFLPLSYLSCHNLKDIFCLIILYSVSCGLWKSLEIWLSVQSADFRWIFLMNKMG